MCKFLSEILYFIRKNIVDLIFLIIFFIFLIIPITSINNNENSKNENRQLALYRPLLNIEFMKVNGTNNEKAKKIKLKPIYYRKIEHYHNVLVYKTRNIRICKILQKNIKIKTIKINYNYGKDYESWIKDRFYGRQFLIFLYENLKYRLSMNVYKAKKGFFIKKNKYFLHVKGSYFYSKTDAGQILKNFLMFKDYLDNKNIRFYIVNVPQKDYILQKYNLIYSNIDSSEIQYLNNESKISIKNFSQILNNKYHINYIDTLDAIKDSLADEVLYYKTDNHMTDYGLFQIYNKLMNFIKKDFPDIKVSTLNDFVLSKNKLVRYNDERIYTLGNQHLNSSIIDNKIFDVEYTYFDYKKLSNINEIIINVNQQRHINSEGKYKLLLIGDSYTKGLVYFLNTSFYDIELYRVNGKQNPFDVEDFYSVIDEFKPDAVVFIRNSGGFLDYLSMYPSKNNLKNEFM